MKWRIQKSIIAKVYAGNLNSAFLVVHPVQRMEQVPVKRGRKDAFKGNFCVFIFAAFQMFIFVWVWTDLLEEMI